MKEENKEQQTITPDQKKMFLRNQDQSKVRLGLVEREKALKKKIQDIKYNNRTLRDGTDKLEFTFKQEFYDALLAQDKISLEVYIINANDEIAKLNREINGIDRLLEDAVVKEEVIVEETTKLAANEAIVNEWRNY